MQKAFLYLNSTHAKGSNKSSEKNGSYNRQCAISLGSIHITYLILLLTLYFRLKKHALCTGLDKQKILA